ncbi:MAG TPA: hypothetical protein VEQ85_14170, partial [Lacipirellulaceae bacterium]|nr:hypothetical protein [Lacipirellulaceae bacterium]
ARSDTWKDGRVGESDIAHVREFFGRQATGALKVLAAHHPFIPPDRDPGEAIVGRAKLALAMLAESGCSLILAGHLHHAYAGDVRPHHVEVQRSILVVQAGTAMSRRRRDEANAFNLLSIDQGGLELDVRTWQGSAFATSGKRLFEYGESGWAVRPA